LKWVRLDCTIDGTYRIPFFVGSMLRGVIGHALKRVVCINPSYECEGCFALRECLYYQFYEKPNSIHQYRLGIRLKPRTLNFSLYLFEDAIDSIPYVVAAVIKAFEEIGIGKEHVKMCVASIHVNERLVYSKQHGASLDNIVPNELEIDRFCQEVQLQFVMPLRMKQNNKIAAESIALHSLINNIHNRYTQLKGLEARSLGYRVRGEVTQNSMKFMELQRYSNRQKTAMNLGGLMGDITIKGLDKQSYMYLKIGEIIGAGKQTVFGLGSYHIIKER